MANKYGPKIVTDGLILYVDAASVKSYVGSGTSWNDLSGNGNNGTLVGATSYATSPARFDTNATSITDQSYLSNSPQLTFADGSEYTFDFYVKLRSGAGTVHQSLLGRLLTHPWLSVRPQNSNGTTWKIYYREFGATYYNTIDINYDLQNNWGNIIITADSSRNVRVYLNGVLMDTINPTTTLFYVNTIMGGYYAGSNYYPFQGSMASCKLYTKLLTESEILQNYNATKGRFGL